MMPKEMLFPSPIKKILKMLHIFSLAGVTGGLLSILVLLILKFSLPGSVSPFPIDYSMLKIFMNLVTVSSFALIGTSALYEFFTEWGFFKYYWIMAKWVVVIVIFVVCWTGLGPAISGMTSISDAGLDITSMKNEYVLFEQKALVFVSIELILILLAGIISVMKPWGKRRETKPVNRKKVLFILVPILMLSLSMPIVQSYQLTKIRNMEINDSQTASLMDGIYQGQALVGNYVYKVNVEVKDKKIVSIESVDPRISPYVVYAEGVFNKIIRDQNANTDAISGATTTSKAYMKAVENALKSPAD